VDDDLFLIHSRRLATIAQLLEEAGLAGRLAFCCNARTSLVDEDLCRTLVRIGVKAMNFGFESGSDRMLRYLKGPGISVKDHARAITLCRDYGIRVYGSVMFASPTETLQDMEQTEKFVDFALSNGAHKLWAFTMTPLPGTPVWEIAKERGKVSDDMNWDVLDLNSHLNPMLLEPGTCQAEFEHLFERVTARLDRAWMKDKWFTMLLRNRRKLVARIRENPWRALTMARNVFLRRQ
jgi:radical SAM superfamily enzyme YgiQ (UPF0313 family)